MKLFLSSMFILWSPIIFSQQRLSGTITDSLGQAVPFASMALLSLPDSAIVKGTMTDETGNYSIDNLRAGRYRLKISAVGYLQKITAEIAIDSSSTNNLVVHIKLSASSHMLGDVAISAIKRVVEIKNGNIVVNIENSPLAQGNSVFDLLAKLPGISVENNTIRIQGKDGVIVMIDDRPQNVSGDALLNMLKGMNADLVKSIELLKNPPVKYDASGTSGMINIISKRVVTTGLTGSIFSSWSQGFYEQLMSGASLNYKAKKIVFYSSISGDQGFYRTVENFKKGFTSNAAITYLNTDFVVKGLGKAIDYKVGVDWMPTKTDVIGIKIDGEPGEYTVKAAGRNSVSGNNTLGFDYLDSKNAVLDTWNTTNLDLNYDHKTDTLGSTFSLVADYSLLTEDIADQNKNQFYDLNGMQVLPANNFRNDNKINSEIVSGRADLVRIINPSISCEAGIKIAHTRTLNDYLFERDYANNDVYLKDSNLSNKFKYTETTYAAYFNYIRSIKKIRMQLGMRIEKTDLTVRTRAGNLELHKEYLNVFPNFSFDYKKSDRHDFQLNISRRIDRPNFNSLMPVMLFRDQYSFSQGNPYLLPDYANRGELTYDYRGVFTTAIAYSYTQNIIMGYAVQNDSTKVTMENMKNMKSCGSLEYSVFYHKSVTKKWEFSINGSFASVDYKGEINGVNFHRTGINSSANLSNVFLIEKNAKLELSGIYLGPNTYNVLLRKQNWMASLALKMSLCKEQLDLTLGLDDIFYSFVWHTSVHFENQNFSYTQTNDTRRFRIALNYKFGKLKIEERAINQSNEEEKGRLKH